jgi:FkbM family methyltransferase
MIRKILAKNNLQDKVEIHEFAIGDFNGNGYLVDNDDGSWGKTISKTFVKGSIKVPMRTLKDVIQDRKIALVKCNTEGGEFSIIPQLINLKLKPELIILMVHPLQGNVDELLKSLVDYGYRKFLVNDFPLNPCWHLIRNQPTEKK